MSFFYSENNGSNVLINSNLLVNPHIMLERDKQTYKSSKNYLYNILYYVKNPFFGNPADF